MTDLAFIWDGLEADLRICANDLVVTEDLDGAVIISLFTDARAPDDEQLPDASGDRRGYWGDSFADIPGDGDGSLLWLLQREKQTQRTLERARSYARKALQWLVDDGRVTAVDVVASFPQLGWLLVEISITLPGRRARKLAFLVAPTGAVHYCNEDGSPGEILGASGVPALDLPPASTVPPGMPGEQQGASGMPAVEAEPFAYGPAGVPGELPGVSGTPALEADPFAAEAAGLPGEVRCMCLDELSVDSTVITVDSIVVTADRGTES